MRARSLILLLAAPAAIAFAAFGVRGSYASFTAAKTVAGNAVGVDRLGNYFAVAPGAATQAGSSAPVAAGDVDTLSLSFGTVPSARTFAGVFTVKNTTAASQTASLSLTGAPQVASAAFAGGAGSVVLAPGATVQVNVATSATTAGAGSGTLRLRLGSSTWLYRDYPLTIAEAPKAPPSLAAAQRPAGAIALGWGASATTVGLAGYDVYRDGSLAASVAAGTTNWTDTATTDGATYAYVVKARSTGASPLSSLPSPTATATADATPPTAPTAVSAGAYVNAAAQGSVSVTVTLPAGSSAGDTVTVTLSDGTSTITRTAPSRTGAGTVVVSGIDASALADGPLALGATATDPSGNVSTAAAGSSVKDTVAPAQPTATYVDDNGKSKPDTIRGGAEAGSTVVATRISPTPAQAYTTTADPGGSYSVDVAASKGESVTYTVVATDAAGNASPARTISEQT